MKLSFTTREYAQLLELVYLGMQTVVNMQGEETPAMKRYADLEQKLLDLATPQGCADLVTVGSDGRLMFSDKMSTDERLGKIIGDHANDSFWRELVHRISDRDLAAEQVRQAATGKTGPAIDAELRLRELEDGLWSEFETNDLANVVLLKGAQG
tara:strand:- start:194 stop:655 length:462 start_codon:yes stop_codon:yes gene_type:complete